MPFSMFCNYARVLKRAIEIIAFLIISLSCYGQISDTRFRHISTEQGLSNSTINCIMQDNRGFMWFGTRDGLNRYDGLKTVIYKNDPKNRNSLSDNFINAIFEGHDRLLWVGTSFGMDCFDPLTDNFTHVILGPGRSEPAGVTSITESDKNHLLVGTSGQGLFLLDKKTGKAVCFTCNNKAKYSIPSDTVNCLYRGFNGKLYIGTKKGAAVLTAGNRFLPVKIDSVTGKDIVSITGDKDNNLWMGINDVGVMRYNVQSNRSVLFRHTDKGLSGLSGNLVLQVYADAAGDVWIGTINNGLNLFNKSNETFLKYFPEPENPGSLSNTTVSAVFEDRQHNYWIGTHRGGINLYTAEFDKFKLYRQGADAKSLSYNDVKAFYEDDKHNIWIGTDGGGLNLFNKDTKTFTHFRNQPGNAASISSDAIQAIAQDAHHNLWVGTWGRGIDLMDTKTGKFKTFLAAKNIKGAISSNFLQRMFLDHTGNFWIATYYGGLNLLDQQTHTFTRIIKDPEGKTSFSGNNVVAINEDHDNNLWFGTDDGGLNRYSLTTHRFSHYFTNTERKTDSRVIFTDSKGRVWVGMNGLYLFDSKRNTFSLFTNKAGLDHEFIKGITEGNRHNLWISTANGMVKLNPVTKVCRQFNTYDGLQGMEFEANSYLKAHDGEMYFGGEKGFNSFYPDNIKLNEFVPPVFITDIQVFNKSLSPGKAGSPLKADISYTKTVELDYRQSSISFSFTALNYIISRNNQYKYKLEGLDKDWTDAGLEKKAVYTSLDPGTYTFIVKAANNDGIWNNTGASVRIIITPPFWMTWWFKLASILVVIVAVYGFYYYRLKTITKQKLVLEQQVKARTAEVEYKAGQLKVKSDQLEFANSELSKRALNLKKLNVDLIKQKKAEQSARQDAEKANKAKSTFLSNMSHEIRTPMNSVIGMASLLAETRLDTDQQEYTNTILSSGEILLNLINDILDFSKIESGNLEIEHVEFDLGKAIKEVLNLFYFKARQQKISLVSVIDQDVPRYITGDSVRIKQVLINLISNALKFTSKGSVSLQVYLKKQTSDVDIQLGFKVKDTGIGIPIDKISKLFKSFSQVDASTTRKYGGTGLGLAICDKLVTLMGGKINVSSEAQRGSEFSFYIQTKTGDSEDKLKTAGSKGLARASDSTSVLDGRAGLAAETAQGTFNPQPVTRTLRILVAEDNIMSQLMVKKMLNKLGYEPDLSANGHEAVDKIKQAAYDLILMDIQMPEMDGIEATRIIRAMPVIQPRIIALTANAMAGDREMYMQTGFDDYLAKPMKIDDLRKTIENNILQKVEA